MRFENDGTGERDVTARIRIQSDAGVQTFGQLRLGYNSANEQLDVRYVRVRKPDGSVVTAGPDAITDMTAPVARDAPVYTDFKEKHVTVPDLAPGVTLEYETVTRLVTPLAPGEFWFDHNFVKSSIVLDEQLEISVPKGRKIDLQSSPSTPYEMVSKDGRTIYTWKQSNLKLPSDDDAKKHSRGMRKRRFLTCSSPHSQAGKRSASGTRSSSRGAPILLPKFAPRQLL